MLTLGIDDAGRGPVIGPMILVGVLVDKELEQELRKLGVKDSKLLNPKKREFLAKIIKKKAFSYHVAITHPNEIDRRLETGTNLNTLEAIKVAQIINKINKSLDKIKVVVDCPSVNTKKWRTTLLKYINNSENIDLICEHKADQNYIAVSAASILAKSTREKEVKKIKKKLKVDFGSGYPADPETQSFLKKYAKKYSNEGIFRKTWSTWKNNHSKKEQKKLKDF